MTAQRPGQPWPKSRTFLVIGLVLALIVGLVLVATVVSYLAGGGHAQQRDTEVITVTRSTQTQTVTLSGTIQPQHQAQVSFKVPGTIESVDVKVGDKVHRGQRLATVGTRDLANAVATAEANLSAARAQLATIRRTTGVRQAQISAAQAQVRAAEAQLSSARNRLADATLTAPIAGTVAKVTYNRGDDVSGTGGISMPSNTGVSIPGLGNVGSGASTTGAGGITIVETSTWKLDATVGTTDLPLLKKGQKASITPTGTSTTVTGTVDTVGIVAEQSQASAASFPVTITVDERTDTLFAGSAADAVVTIGTFPQVLAIPAAAITTTDDGTSTVKQVGPDQEVDETTVTLGRRFGALVEITAGLAEGDRIQVPRGVIISKAPVNPWEATPSSSPSR